jgi:hypothetical protein
LPEQPARNIGKPRISKRLRAKNLLLTVSAVIHKTPVSNESLIQHKETDMQGQDAGHAAKVAHKAVQSKQGGTYGAGKSVSEILDKNRGSDKGGTNAPRSTNAKN